jgi:hypothetical protein
MSPLLILLLLALPVGTLAQCVGVIDPFTNRFCITAGTSKTFSNATASGGTIDWLSSGSGVFNNNTLVRPRYTPSATDIAAGQVFIYLMYTAIRSPIPARCCRQPPLCSYR